ncbi:hypothetical protein D3C86_1757730 [compost metagenome]
MLISAGRQRFVQLLMLAGPERQAAEEHGDRRHQKRPDDEGVEQHPDRGNDAKLHQHLNRQAGQDSEGSCQDKPRGGDNRPGLIDSFSNRLLQRHMFALLPDVRDHEDVIILAECNQEDEGIQRNRSLNSISAQYIMNNDPAKPKGREEG